MERIGTFEEWYQWEMKKRSSKRVWHYPTTLEIEDGKVIYRQRRTDQVRNLSSFVVNQKI